MNRIHTRQWVSIGIGLLSLVLCFGYIVRTRTFLGDQVATQVVRTAKLRKLDIEIGDIRPHGLLGLTLANVALRIPKEDMAVECQFDTLVVTPSLRGLIRGDIEVESLVVNGGSIAVVPWTASKKSRLKKPPTLATKAKAKTKPKSKPAPRASIDIELHDVSLRGPLAGAKPLKIARMDFTLDQKMPKKIRGYGEFPDGTRFGVRTDEIAGKEHVTLRPDRRTQVHDWVGADLPLQLSTTGFSVCLSCESEQVVVNDVEFSSPKWSPGARLTAPRAEFSRDGSLLRLETLEMELERETSAEFGARVVRTRVELDAADGTLSGRFKIAAANGGTLDVDWDFHHEFDLTIWAEEFAISSIWDALQLDVPIKPNLVNGTARAMIGPNGVIELEGNLSFDALEVNLPRVSGTPLLFKRTKVKGHLLLDIRGRALSVSEAAIKLGASEEIHLKGQLVDANQGWSFFGHANAPKLNALTFRDGLPSQLTTVADGAIFDGDFGFSLTVGGHSAFAESLFLEGEMYGDVTVQRDAPLADVISLKTNGPPPMLANAQLENWRSYAQLPPLVPTVMMAAEDAGFFRHPGFDWDGFKRAMIHNIGAGALKRGGSTISQQVIKNVFLTHERSLGRKLQEAYLTWRMETEVPKERILEIYINIVDWGGVVGIAQASHHYFKAEPQALEPAELAMLAAILPNPARFGGAIKKGKLPSSRMHKIGRILKNLAFMKSISYADYKRGYDRSLAGQIGRLNLVICDDDGSVKDAPTCY